MASNEQGGVGCFTLIGIVWAVILSWELNESFFWVLVAGVFNWLYVLYYAIAHGNPWLGQ